jgi:hypothetical protein
LIYSDTDRRPVRILRIATPGDIAEHGKEGQPSGRDPGVYRASRSPGNTTVLCEYFTGEPGYVLCNVANMMDDGNGMERSIVMNQLLGSAEGG